MVKEVIVRVIDNGFVVSVYTGRDFDEPKSNEVFCKSVNQLNAVFKELFPKTKAE